MINPDPRGADNDDHEIEQLQQAKDEREAVQIYADQLNKLIEKMKEKDNTIMAGNWNRGFGKKHETALKEKNTWN